jgi:peptidoglycan/xylan/chitin deacetylase (PgdA/CDA1 family)
MRFQKSSPVIMYHRIQNKPRCCNIDIFEQQVRKAKQNSAILTFDDTLKEHYTIALPILKKHNMKGIFFIITNIDKQLANVHKTWVLLKHANKLVKELNISNKKFLSPEWYDYDPIPISNLKYYLNINPTLLDEIFYNKFDEEQIIENMYMNWDEINELYAEGMEIGGHTHTHPILANLSVKEQEKEIMVSTNILNKKNLHPVSFAYPFGEYTNDTVELLKKHGYQKAFTSKPINFFELGRIDTNEY